MRGIGYMYQHNYKAMKPRQPKAVFEFDADDVWSAAAQAFAINGSYIKVIDPEVKGQKTNKQIVTELLADTTQITDESREKGQAIRQYFKGLTFKVLQGKVLSEFNNTAMVIAERDVITTNFDVSVIVSLPATYEKAIKRDVVDRRINFASGGFLGQVGDKIEIEIEVIKQLWSGTWNTWYVTGVTDDDKVVFFAYKKQELIIGDRVKIKGTVKSHRDTSTQLNRVKVV